MQIKAKNKTIGTFHCESKKILSPNLPKLKRVKDFGVYANCLSGAQLSREGKSSKSKEPPPIRVRQEWTVILTSDASISTSISISIKDAYALVRTATT